MRAVLALIGLPALLGCGATQAPALAPPPPAAPPAASSADTVSVALIWSAPVDLDLYVTDPSQETVYFANPESKSGGRLERDVTCESIHDADDASPLEELAEWRAPPGGRYRIGVDFSDGCGGAVEEAEFRLVADVHGKRREHLAKVRKVRFEPIVLEFDVPGQ